MKRGAFLRHLRVVPVVAGVALGMASMPHAMAQGSDVFARVLTQYSQPWTIDSGFRVEGTMWDPGASFELVFERIPPAVRDHATRFNTAAEFNAWRKSYQGALRGWATGAQTAGLSGQALVQSFREFLLAFEPTVLGRLERDWPGQSRDVYRAMIIQNLAHAYHHYATSTYYEVITDSLPGQTNRPILVLGELSVANQFRALLEQPVADCGEVAEFVRVMGRIWGLDTRYLGMQFDYVSSIAGGQRIATGAHAAVLLVYRPSAQAAPRAVVIDALTNTTIDLGNAAGLLPGEMVGDDVLALTVTPAERYSALAAAGRIRQSFNLFMHPPVRAGYLKSGTPDASLQRFMYAYYLEAYPNAPSAAAGSVGWQVNNAAYSLLQPLF